MKHETSAGYILRWCFKVLAVLATIVFSFVTYINDSLSLINFGYSSCLLKLFNKMCTEVLYLNVEHIGKVYIETCGTYCTCCIGEKCALSFRVYERVVQTLSEWSCDTVEYVPCV